MRIFLSVILSAIGLAFTSISHSETQFCVPITHIPFKINQPGVYCLTADLSSAEPDEDAIIVFSDHVVIDLNGHRISGLAAGAATRANGVGGRDRSAVTVKNGSIEGFAVAVSLIGLDPANPVYGNRVEGIRALRNTTRGLIVEGAGAIVRKNQVIKTGGHRLPAEAIGIEVTGPGASVTDNLVVDTVGSSTTRPDIGINVNGSNVVVEKNSVSNAQLRPASKGIHITATAAQTSVLANRIAKFAIGIDAGAPSNGYAQNIVAGAERAFQGGIDLGGNASY